MSDDGMSKALAEVSFLWHLLIFSLEACYINGAHSRRLVRMSKSSYIFT